MASFDWDGVQQNEQKPSCCFWREAVITCGLLSHLIKEEKLILESWDWNTHRQRCNTYTHISIRARTHTLCTSINTQACTHPHMYTPIQSPEARSLIELSHRSTDCFFPSPLFVNQQRVGGGEKRDGETRKEAERERNKRERREERLRERRRSWGEDPERNRERWRCWMVMWCCRGSSQTDGEMSFYNCIKG